MKNNAGFTLVEIMIVLALVVLLTSFVGINVIKQFGQGQEKAAKIQIATFEQALQAYYLDSNMYPHTSQGLQSLIQAPTVGRIPKNYPEGGYLKKSKVPEDPWGAPYRYACENYQNYTITSDGKDATPGTEDDVSSEDQ